MFNIHAFLQMININSDNIISKSEIEKNKKTLSGRSIFTDYINSIHQDVSLDEFGENIDSIYSESGVENPELTFKTKEQENKYNKLTKEAIQKDIDMIYQECKFYMWKTSGKEEFDKLFNQYLKECMPNYWQLYEKMQQLELTKPVTMKSIQDSGTYDITLPAQPLPDVDWSNSRDVFNYLSFYNNTFANTSKEHLPQGYDPEVVFENGKTIGLNIDKVHEKGYDGAGVSYAIIDSGMDAHNAVHVKEYNVAESADKKTLNHFHGYAVSYIAQEIAPNADCYYYALNNSGNIAVTVLENLKSILEKNKSLPKDKKIRFVSMSMPLYGGEEAKKVVKELEAQGVWVHYSGCKEDKTIGYLGKKDPAADPNDFDNYQIEAEAYGDLKLYVNSGDRTVPDPAEKDAFRHDSRASQSWSIPVIAGYYTLACQADPSMTKEKFLKLAEETAQVKQSNLPIYQPINQNDWRLVGRTVETTEMKIIDIDALISKIEQEKS